MTPTELAAAVKTVEDLVHAACPLTDPKTGANADTQGQFSNINLASDIRRALDEYHATPQAVAQYLINTIKSYPPFANLPGYWAGWHGINGEGFTTLASHFAPKGTTHKGPSPAEIKANAIKAGNVQWAREGKPFLGLDGVAYERERTPGPYDVAAAALLAASPAQPAPVSGPPFGVGTYTGPERRVSGVANRRGAVSTGTPGQGPGLG